MNQQRSTYQTDFTPHAWLENNFGSTDNEFCSSDNIDDCLKHISQELSALGYPSIYCNPSSCPYAVNCDIVKFINIIFELLKDFKEHTNVKEELEDRNQRLLTDLNVVNKKNHLLKERLDQSERKYNSALEKERQLKVKNNNLQQFIKNEKEESKKLSSQIQHQKIAYQHEVRKYENQLHQMKSRLTQIISDKNPDKKIANITTSHLLSRNSNQRGKWNTGTSVKSSTEEMFNSLLSNNENRHQAALKEIEEYQQCLKYIELQIMEIISLSKENLNQETSICLEAIFNETNLQALKEKFSSMLSKLKEIVASKISSISDEKVLSSPLNTSNQEPSTSKDQTDACNINNIQMENIIKEKKEISETLAQIKEEKIKLEGQKLEMLNIALKQKSSIPVQSSESLPSFAVVTTKSDLTGVCYTHQLKQCLSAPEEMITSMPPLWKLDLTEVSQDNSENISNENFNEADYSPPSISSNECIDDELPKWAHTAISKPIIEQPLLNENSFVSENAINDELEISEFQIAEEENLAKLRAAIEDIENRRHNYSSKKQSE